MSSHASIITEIMNLIELKDALNALELKYKELTTIKTLDGCIHNVDVAIKGPKGSLIGLEKAKDCTYRFIADTCGLTAEEQKDQTKIMNKVRQKYAYNKIVGELKKQGYIIAEEKKIEDDTIKLVARKWG